MNKNFDKNIHLTEHFTLDEMCKTSIKTKEGNIPSSVHIENLKRLCGWLEALRTRKNQYAKLSTPHQTGRGEGEGLYINSGYRSPAVNKAVGGVATSNHLTGCAADIRCTGIEQALRYAAYLLDISKERGENFDEIIIEHRVKTGNYWVHFAVRASGNRRKVKIASL